MPLDKKYAKGLYDNLTQVYGREELPDENTFYSRLEGDSEYRKGVYSNLSNAFGTSELPVYDSFETKLGVKKKVSASPSSVTPSKSTATDPYADLRELGTLPPEEEPVEPSNLPKVPPVTRFAAQDVTYQTPVKGLTQSGKPIETPKQQVMSEVEESRMAEALVEGGKETEILNSPQLSYKRWSDKIKKRYIDKGIFKNEADYFNHFRDEMINDPVIGIKDDGIKQEFQFLDQIEALKKTLDMRKKSYADLKAGGASIDDNYFKANIEETEKELNEKNSEYQKFLNTKYEEIDGKIALLNRQRVQYEDVEDLNEIDEQIRQLENEKKFFFKGGEDKAQAVYETVEPSISKLNIPGNTVEEKLKNYTAALFEEFKDLNKQIYGQDGLQGALNATGVDVLGITDNIPYKTRNRYDRVVSELQFLVPALASNRNPLFTAEVSAPQTFKKSLSEQLWPGLAANMQNAAPEIANQMTSTFNALGVADQVEEKGFDVKTVKMEENKDGVFYREPSVANKVADMLGTTTGIVADFIVTSPVPGGGKAASVLKAERGLERLAAIAKYSKNYGKFAYYGLSGVKNISQFAARAAQQGVDYAKVGVILPQSADEANFTSGVAGYAGESLVRAVGGRIGLAQLMKGIFGEKATEVATRVFGRGAGELGEESAQTLYDIWKTTDNGKGFVEEIERQFPETEDKVIFALSAFIMGAAMGGSSQYSSELLKTSSDIAKDLSPDQKTIYDKVSSEISQDMTSAIKEAQNEGELVKPVEEDVNQLTGEIIPRLSKKAEAALDPKYDDIKEQLIKGGKIVVDEDGDVVDAKQNSGFSSQLYKDFKSIADDGNTALNEYLAVKQDNGEFKKKFGDWENSIMKDYGRGGYEYTIKRAKTPEQFKDSYVWVTEGEKGNPVIHFNGEKVRRDADFPKVKQEYMGSVVENTEGTPEQKAEYKELYDKTVNKLRDLKLHLIHQELIRKQKGSVSIEDDIRSIREIERLNGIELAKDYYGEPMLFMHAGKEGISKFLKPGDEGYVKNDDLTGSAGIYFSRHLEQAQKYSNFNEKPGEGKDIYYTFLRTKNPYHITDPRAQADYPLKNTTTLTNEDVEALKAKGYDSVIWSTPENPKYEVVVFDPDQVEIIGSYREGLRNKSENAQNSTTTQNEISQERRQDNQEGLLTAQEDTGAVETAPVVESPATVEEIETITEATPNRGKNVNIDYPLEFSEEGGNKIVNEQGEPIVVYRGYNTNPYQKMKGRIGLWFTTDPERAKTFGKNVSSFLVRSENPSLEHFADIAFFNEEQKAQADDLGIDAVMSDRGNGDFDILLLNEENLIEIGKEGGENQEEETDETVSDESRPKRKFTKQVVKDLPEDVVVPKDTVYYDRLPNSATLTEANKFIERVGEDESISAVLDMANGMTFATRFTVAQVLIKKLQSEGRYGRALEILEMVTKKATELGQGIQALSLYSYLTPEGQMKAAEREVKRQNAKKAKRDQPKIDKLISELNTVNEATVNEILDSETIKSIREEIKINNTSKRKKIQDKREALLKKMRGDLGSGINPEYLVELVKTYIEEGIVIAKDIISAIKKNLPDVDEDQLTKIIEKLPKPDPQASLDEIVRSHYTVYDSNKQKLVNKIVDKTGLTGADAKKYAQKISEEFDKLASKKKKQILDKMFSRKERKKPNIKSLEQKLVEISNLGAFDNEDIIKAWADHMGYITLSPANLEQIKKLAEKVQNAPEGFKRSRAVQDLLAYQENLKGVNKFEVGLSLWYANILSGPMTQLVNLVSGLWNTLTNYLVALTQRPWSAKNAALMAKGLVEGFGRGIFEGLDVLRTGYSPIRGKAEIPNILERTQFWGKKFNPANYAKYVRRLMVAVDTLIFEAQKEMRTYQIASKMAREQNRLTPNDQDLVSASQIMNKSDDSFQAAKEQAQLEYEQELEKDPDNKKQLERDRKRRIYEIIEQGRDPKLFEDATVFATKGTYNFTPEGVLGAIANHINRLTEDVPAVKLIVPFTNIIANVANESINYSPFGFIRRARGGYISKNVKREFTDQEKVDLTTKAVMGTVLMGALYLLSQPGDDREDPVIEITANGTGDYRKNYELKGNKRGWQPYSIGIGNKWISYKETPLFFAFSFIGQMRDYEKYRGTKITDEGLQTQLGAAFRHSSRFLLDQTFLSSLNNFLSSAIDPRNENRIEDLFNQANKTISGAILPNLYTQSARQIEDWYNIPLKDIRDKWLGVLLQDIPVARDQFYNKVNVLGEPVTPDTDKILSNVEPDKLFDLIVQKRAFIGMPNRKTLRFYDPVTDSDRLLTDAEWYKFCVDRGTYIKGYLEENYDKLIDKSPEVVREILDKVKMDATSTSKDLLFLENLEENNLSDTEIKNLIKKKALSDRENNKFKEEQLLRLNRRRLEFLKNKKALKADFFYKKLKE